MTEQNLYIRVDESGAAMTHPISEENLKMFFPDISPNNIPKGFVLFVRKPEPEVDLNNEFITSTYGVDELLSKTDKKVYTDIHEIKPLGKEDRERIIEEFKTNNPNFKDWVFDETVNTLVPPIPKPDDNKDYVWTVGGGWIEKPKDLDTQDHKFNLMIENETYNLNKGQTQTIHEDKIIYYIKLIQGSITIDNNGPNILFPGDVYYNDGSKPSVVTALEDNTVIVSGIHNYQLEEFLGALPEEERIAFIKNMNYEG